jgi:hypothetical protein
MLHVLSFYSYVFFCLLHFKVLILPLFLFSCNWIIFLHSIILGFPKVGLGCYSTISTLFYFPWFFHWKKVQVCNCKQNNWSKLHVLQKLEFNIFFLEAKGEDKFMSQHELVFLAKVFHLCDGALTLLFHVFATS